MVEKRFLAGSALITLLLVSTAHATPPTTAILGTPPQPGWSLLSTEQRIILAPLVKDWDEMDNIQRKKWLGIAERFPKMTTDEQSRVQERMREWASLTPEKRAKVRDGYKDFQQLPPDKKLAVKQKWENYYSSLPDEEKQRIRGGGKIARPTTPNAAEQDTSTTSVADAKAGSDSPDTTKR